MSEKLFSSLAAVPGSRNWDRLISREAPLYHKKGDVRTPFIRDYTRILHSMAYRRLKHKTQVFYNIDNDHICTRMEHVAHVDSVSSTIARALGLNDELTRAISIGHDLGHAPFGHYGEVILNELSRKYLGTTFWHERNGLRFVDNIELLADRNGIHRNLNLTYAVRDGIISHCGEIDTNGLKPRADFIDLEEDFQSPGQYEPVTWEGCVVKISDKIAYIGRDIEDAIRLGFLGDEQIEQLRTMARADNRPTFNNTVIMHNLIIDICENSSPEDGICLSSQSYDILTQIKEFNYKYIYKNRLFDSFQKYADLVMHELFRVLFEQFDGENTWKSLQKEEYYHPILISNFMGYLCKYCDDEEQIPYRHLRESAAVCDNRKIYGSLSDETVYAQAVIDYISGMTDRFAVESFNELLTYRTVRPM